MRIKYLNSALFFIIFFFVNTFLFSQNGIITGKVKCRETILQSATVSLDNKIILTDENGNFSFSKKPGSYILIVTHAGYNKLERNVTVITDSIEDFVFEMTRKEQLGEVVVLGSRSTISRSNMNTPVPVDALSTNQLLQTGQVSLTQMLNYSAPSFNASREVFNEPATLRGLDPEHTLILLNGIRYHNMAWLNAGNIKGQLGRGSVGNDLNSIPFSAIEKIEVLRDGASAQYGSDAIAGVLNIVLKESTGTSIQLHTGQYYEGDGEKISLGINHGILFNSLAGHGFLNFSGNFRYQAPTYRGGVYEGPVYYRIRDDLPERQKDSLRALDNQQIEVRNFDRKTAVSNVGNSQNTIYGIGINGCYHISKRTELYGTVMMNNRSLDYIGAYRFAKDTNQVNLALYPEGFKARIHTKTFDFSGIAGVKGETKNDWHWEFNSAYGNNFVNNNVSNTNNASQWPLGKYAPTEFYVGKNIFNQFTNNLSFARDLGKSTSRIKSFNTAFGAEYRIENYRTTPGEEASWKNYDASGIIKDIQGGSQGFAGANPDFSVNKNRTVWSTYLDIETDLNDHLILDIAGRYEYYNDFGGNLAGKFSGRYKFSKKFLLRTSVSNGFRAPSMQQRYQGGTATRWANSGTVRVPVRRGTFPNDHKVTRAFGIPQLEPEKTVNVSGGITSALFKWMTITVDAYWIQIKNRIVLSGVFDKKNSVVASILVNHPDIDQVQFYTNAINTRTKGIDVVINGNWNINKSNIAYSLVANFTRTRLFGPIKTSDKLPADSLNTNTLFNMEERTKVEEGQPDNKIILSLTYKKGKTGFILRNSQFGKTSTATIFTNPDRILLESFSSKILTDISINYSPKKWFTITGGINNVFNVYPDRLKNYDNTINGILLYSNEASPFGFNGGYYYLNMAFNW